MADSISYTDLASAREQLGLPTNSFDGYGGRGRLLRSLAVGSLFRTTLTSNPSLGPVGEVLDGTRIDLAVSTALGVSPPGSGVLGPLDVAVVGTRQPFDEIETRLRERGYEEAGDGLLVGDKRIDESRGSFVPEVHDHFPFPAVGEAEGGVVVLGGSLRAARAALTGDESELSIVARLVERLPGVARVGDNQIPGDTPNLDTSCVEAVGLGEDARPRTGAMEVIVSGSPDSDRALWFPDSSIVNLAQSRGGSQASPTLEFGKAVATEDGVAIEFKSTDNENRTMLGIENAHAPYDCG